MSRYMNLMTDFAFKYVFGSEKNKPVLIKFLNRVLDEEDRIVDVSFRDKEAMPFASEGKRVVFDIYCVTELGHHIIVEMQRNIQPTFSDRALSYCAYAMMKQVGRGANTYMLNNVYGIFIMDFHLPGHRPQLVTNVGLYDFESKTKFSDRLKMIFLDLKMMNHESLDDCENDFERWLFLLKNMEKMESKPEKYPEFYELFDAADTSSMCCEDVVEYSKSRQRMLDERQGVLYYGEEQRKAGIEEGRKEGIKEGIKEGARKTMISFVNRLRAQGMTATQISSMLGIPGEEIEAIPSA